MKGSPRPGSIAEAKVVQGKTPYGEESRRYRRTIYRHEDWLMHRSETRLLRNLAGAFTSGVVRSLISEILAVALVAVLVVVWNSALFGYVDLQGSSHPGVFGDVNDVLKLTLPISLFTLSSPALGLLLVFRTNTSYSRWLEARQAWGRIVSHSRNIMRQSTLWLDDSDPTALGSLHEVRLCTWAFPRSLWAHLSDPAKEPRFAQEVREAMGTPEAAKALLDAPHRPLRALSLLSAAMDRLPIDEKKKVEMDKSVILLGDACEVCERIFSSPVPLVYTRHTARFLSAWLLLLPIGLYEQFGASWNHVALVPAATIVAIFLFGIEELAVQLEEPFSILPLEALCADIQLAGEDMVTGMASTRQPLPVALRSTGVAPSRRSRRSGDVEMIIDDGASAPLASALAALSSVEVQERYFAAGGLCASFSHGVATPVDVVKTRQQTVPGYEELSLAEGLARVARDEGPQGLLTGIVPTMVGYGAEGALKFGAYEALKPTAATFLATLGLSSEQAVAIGPIASAVIAGGLASLVLAPVEATRIRMVSDSAYAERGLLGAAKLVYDKEGADGLLRGVPATCSKQLPYTATKQVTFDALIDAASRTGGLPRWASTIGAAGTAAVLSTLASQPGDAILSEVSKGGGGGDAGVLGVGARLGASGLLRGLRARLVHVGIIVTVQLILYDTLKHAFGVP